MLDSYAGQSHNRLMRLIKQLLQGKFGVWLGLYPIFAVNEEDCKRIIKAAEFQPNDVY
jgi:hypothetical protein